MRGDLAKSFSADDHGAAMLGGRGVALGRQREQQRWKCEREISKRSMAVGEVPDARILRGGKPTQAIFNAIGLCRGGRRHGHVQGVNCVHFPLSVDAAVKAVA
jgi:hypothetical protein